MAWTADVPFPAEDLGKCRGCNAPIGWVRHEDEHTGLDKAHPVDPKGWAGIPCGPGTPGCKKGYTREGEKAAVSDPGDRGLFSFKELDVVFTSHFATCPKASKFFPKRPS